MPRPKTVVSEEKPIVEINGEKVDLEELLKSVGEEVKPEELPKVDWLSVKNKLNFVDYVELRKKYGLEG